MSEFEMILDFMHRQNDCVLSTCGPDSSPQSAVVGFSENERGELMFGTFDASRKYQNLQRDSRVSVVIGFDGSTTVQFEGTARQLIGDELLERQKAHFKKIPEVEQYKDEPGEVYFSITPTWVRYTNYHAQPWEIHEWRFDENDRKSRPHVAGGQE
jgi:general stress protein 26